LVTALEFAAGSVYARKELFSMAFKPVDGFFQIPEGPGLGIELDESKFQRYPSTGIQYNPRYYPDGTVGEI